MNVSLLDLYCSYHPEFLNSLEIFSEINKKRILKNLKTHQNKNNFLSTIAEVKFGELFTKLNFEIEYDKKYYNKQTPDWSLIYENSVAICEVYRLGKSKKDQIYCDFENQIKEVLVKLRYNYFIKINFFDEDIDLSKFNTNIIINEVEDWLRKSTKVIGDRIIVNTNFEFEVIKTNTNVNHLCFIGPAKSIDYKPHKLKQVEYLNDNEITKKLKKYNNVILKENLAYFICVSVDFVSGFDIADFSEFFLGMGVENIDYGTPFNEPEEFKHWGSTWTELGKFYDNPQLSGIIIYYNNSFTFLINPNQKQIIYHEKNNLIKEKLLKINE